MEIQNSQAKKVPLEAGLSFTTLIVIINSFRFATLLGTARCPLFLFRRAKVD